MIKIDFNKKVLESLTKMGIDTQKPRFNAYTQTQIKSNLESICNNLPKKSEYKFLLSVVLKPFSWSPTMKHPGFEVNHSILTRKLENSNSGICCLGNWQMSNAVINYSWGIKINTASPMGVGICIPNAPVKLNFLNLGDNRELGHGHYTVSQGGYVLSNSDESINNKESSFKYTKGDVLLFEYNTKIGKLRITNNKEKI